MSNDVRGQLLVVSSPSGAGKTTLCTRLRREFSTLGFSVSYTTRPPRPGESDGVEYNFVTREEFDAMIREGAFAEHAEVHGNLYGSGVEVVESALAEGRDLLFDIDHQGGRQLAARFGADVVLVFVMPPSQVELERRLRGRGTDAEDVIARRLAAAKAEMEHFVDYEFVVVNDELDAAYASLRAIYIAGRHRTSRMSARARQIVDGRKSEPVVASVAAGQG